MWQKIQSFFSFQTSCCIGCYADDARLFISVNSSSCFSEEMQSVIIPLEVSVAPEDYFKEIAAQIKLYCIREGVKRPGIIFCLKQREVFQYQKKFPVMQARELRKAVRWDAEANVPFKEGTYSWDFICREENKILIAAAENVCLHGLQAAFLDEELFLCGIAVEPDEELVPIQNVDTDLLVDYRLENSDDIQERITYEYGDLIASWAARLPESKTAYLNFLAGSCKMYKLLWTRIVSTGIAGCVLLVSMIYCFNCWELYNLEKQEKQNTYQLSLLRNDLENKSEAEHFLQCSRKKNGILLELSQNHFSWYGLMVHLGSMTMADVWLTEVAFQTDHILKICGKASDYSALAAFLNQFDEKTIVFSEKPVLQNARMDKNASIDFSILVRLKGT